MRIHRVFSEQPLQPGEEALLSGGPAHYLGRVLRVVPGQSIVLFNGDGFDYVAEVVQATRQELRLAVQRRLPAIRESALQVTVVQAISRGERMDQTLQKCTELGAVAFQPVLSERVEVRLSGAKLERRVAHWQGVVISACEQSGRAVVPPVSPLQTLDEWARSSANAARLVLSPDTDIRLAALELPASVELLVGPEGGFSDTELSQLYTAGVRPASMGPRVLRTETAAPAALAVLQALHGDF